MSLRQQVERYFSALHDDIVAALEKLDTSAPPFKSDSWTRANEGGSGRSSDFAAPYDSASADTYALEKAGVNTSVIRSVLSAAARRQMGMSHPSIPQHDPAAPLALYTTGISVIVHPRNPHAPSVHAHFRYVEVIAPDAEPGAEVVAWWFGGCTDLTPSYLYEADARHFHGTLRGVCDAHGPALYPLMKHWCDEYFVLRHREEARGLGGIFFRDLSDAPHARLDGEGAPAPRPRTQAEVFAFVRALSGALLPAYLPILTRRMRTPSDARARRWQLLRRGRYVEFCLVCDDGTKFGLTNPAARIESVFSGMPEIARWEYTSDLGQEGDGSVESQLVEVLKHPREWA